MKNIIAKLEVNETHRTMSITIDELGFEQDEWDKKTDEEKHEEIKNFIYDLPEQPYWSLDKFIEQQ